MCAVASEHYRYYSQQELKRDEIMKKKLENQKKRFSDYSLVGIRNKHFIVYKKENFTKEDEESGISYRVDFYIGNTTCSIFTNSTYLDKSIEEVDARFSK